ncbi:MAG: lytic murein transglycosylase [Limimaricola sp.]|uniref:lytic murein transglycosylase n=1 Tax=Limimaricola sp. TaxID=2211665 RepID=UPI001D2A7D2F|nr:lytic murein transglycosylase [Limimaricola sp.]MBI1418681.1 lytic murein transglycosylase [Limimaricola sp.]
MRVALTLIACLAASGATAQTCGGPFGDFVAALKRQAVAQGYAPALVDGFFAGVRNDQNVLAADRRQGFFQKDFIAFSRSLISQNRLDNGRRYGQRYAQTFATIESRYGIPSGVLLAFWAFETDFGQVQGDVNTRDALVTLAHDCRRPQLFLPQVMAALELYKRGDFDPATTTGAWAGEIGQVQMLPADILASGQDGDGDGHVRLKTSAPDALLSGAAMLSRFGWRPNEPWLQEIIVPPGLDLRQTGLNHTLTVRQWQAAGVQARTGDLGPGALQASVLLPMGQGGPAFLAYPNFNVYLEWNQSLVYVTTAAYFATRLMGAPVYTAGNPDPGLTGPQMQELQRKLQARGYDVGGVDGILGEKTREAVQREQERLGLPADAWPTTALLSRL